MDEKVSISRGFGLLGFFDLDYSPLDKKTGSDRKFVLNYSALKEPQVSKSLSFNFN
jgi:hypothetical protein